MKLAAASGFGVADICQNTDVCLGINPALKAGFFHLRDPDARTGARTGAKVLPNALPTVGLVGIGAAGPVFCHVGTTFVVPTVDGYEPTEGAVTVPYPPNPGACASANVLVRVKAVASAIVVSFMSCPCCLAKRQPHRILYRSINSS
jgi:hypothetical protein